VRRRQFITLLGGAAAAWPLAARAQQVERMRRIGVLMALAADDPEGQARIKVFEQGLNELGWSVIRNLRIDYRWAAGDTNRYRSYAAELLALAPPSSAMNSRRLTASIGLPATGCVFTYSIKPV
jgi:putative tryptophan/tyrosine transport system substrate-binding protein